MTHPPHRDPTSRSKTLAVVREASAVTLALLVFLATFRLVRFPLLALPVAGLVYWGVRSWFQRIADGGVSRIGRHVARLRELAASLTRQAADSKHSAPSRSSSSAAAGRLCALAEELEQLDHKLESHPDQAVEVEFFIEVQLPQATDLMERYAELAGTPEPDERVRSELRAMEDTLDLLVKAVRDQSRRFSEKDLHEFAIDRRAFEELLRLDASSAASTAASSAAFTSVSSGSDFRSEAS